MRRDYLYRGGMMCLSLAMMTLSAYLLIVPEANDNWHFLVFMLLLAAFAFFQFHDSMRTKQDQ